MFGLPYGVGSRMVEVYGMLYFFAYIRQIIAHKQISYSSHQKSSSSLRRPKKRYFHLFWKMSFKPRMWFISYLASCWMIEVYVLLCYSNFYILYRTFIRPIISNISFSKCLRRCAVRRWFIKYSIKDAYILPMSFITYLASRRMMKDYVCL